MTFLQASSFFKNKIVPSLWMKNQFFKNKRSILIPVHILKTYFTWLPSRRGGLIHKRQSNKTRRPLGASLEFTFGMYFSEGPNFLLVGVKILLVGSNNEIKLVSKLTLVRCQIFVYLGTKLKLIL